VKIIFAALSEEERTTQFAGMDSDALDAALTETRTEATRLFALDAPTVDDADKAEKVVASLNIIEAEQERRAAVAADAAARFAAAKATFSTEAVNDGVEDSDDETDEDETEEDEADDAEADEDEADEDAEEVEAAAKKKKNPFEKDEEEAVTTASGVDHTRSQRISTSAASKVGRKTKRPAVKASAEVVITAAADVEGFGNGQRLTGMSQVAEAVMARVKGFPKFNARAAEQTHEQSGGAPVLNRFGTASFSVPVDAALTASKAGSEEAHIVVKEAVKRHVERVNASIGLNGVTPTVQTAAMAWCSPSEVVYNWIADYVVDGLLDLPEIAAPRGGLMLTEGPRLAQDKYGTEAAVDAFGFGGTEAEMEAGYVKTCETIECPEFVDHRLDFDGYCWKIPILTEATFPELVADAMRLSDVLYAHKMNRRFIKDVLAKSTAIDATNALGAIQMDTLEAFTQVAIKERRWWNLGENAVMEVKFPQVARDIFKMDMARRSGLALNDVATDQKVAAHFAAYNLAVTYISDFDQRYGAATPTADWPETIRGIMYPAGTFVKSVKPVINLSSVYDAASLSENEYTGVFFEQGVMTIKRGYRSHVIEVPVCVAGRTGANDLTCTGFDTPAFDGSF
jgi:hypothetical protein